MQAKKLVMIIMILNLLMMNISLGSEPTTCDIVLDKCAKVVESQKRALELKDLNIVNIKNKVDLLERRNVDLEKEASQYKTTAIIAFLMAIGAAFL
jgi:hypothetical protein